MLELLLDEIAHAVASLLQRGLDFYHLNIKKAAYDDRWHFVMEFNAGKLTIQYISHLSYLQKLNEQVAIIYYHLDPENFIRITLGMCKHCNYLLFDCVDEEVFIQFWVADGNIICSYPIKETNNLGQHISSVVALLHQLDITQDQNSEGEMPRHTHTFSISSTSDCEEYCIHFGTDTQKAAQFTRTVIEDIFGYTFAKVSLELG